MPKKKRVRRRTKKRARKQAKTRKHKRQRLRIRLFGKLRDTIKRISDKDFEKIELRIATITGVKKHPAINEYIIALDLGVVKQKDAQVVADLAHDYKMKELLGMQVIYVANARPIMVRGIESMGMILVTYNKGRPVLISPKKRVEKGVKVYGMRDTDLCAHEEYMGR